MKIKRRVLGTTEIASMNCVMIGKLGDVYPCIVNGFHPHTGGKETDYSEMYSAVDWMLDNRVNRGCPAVIDWIAQQLRFCAAFKVDLDSAIQTIFAGIDPCERTISVCRHIWDNIPNVTYSEEDCDRYCEDIDFYLNQNFLRVRTGGKLNPGSADAIYFRISSKDYDWRPVIEDFLWDTFEDISKMPSTIWIGHDAETNPPEVVLFEGTPEDLLSNYDARIFAKTKLKLI